MPKHILLLAIVAGFFIADSAEAQFLRRLFGLGNSAPAYGQQFGGQQFGGQQQFRPQDGPQFGQQGGPQFGQQFRQQFGQQPGPQYNGAQPLNQMQRYQQQQAYYQRQTLTPQQVANGQRPMPVRPQYGQERFQNVQLRPVRRYMETQFGQQNLMRDTLVTIQTPNGPQTVRVQIPNMNVASQPFVQSAQMPLLQTQQPVQSQANEVAAQPVIQQPLSVGPSQNSMPNSSITGVVQPLETQTTQAQPALNAPALNGPALSGPALSGPAVVSPVTEDDSTVVPASATIEEVQEVAPITLDEAAPSQIPDLDAPSEDTETKTQGAPSILKKK